MTEVPSFTPAEAFLADIVVGDTIRTSFTDPDFIKAASVEDALDMLKGDKGDEMVQYVLATYALSEMSARKLGVEAEIDMRLVSEFGNKFINVTSKNLKKAMIQGLQNFLDLPTEQANARVAELIAQTPQENI